MIWTSSTKLKVSRSLKTLSMTYCSGLGANLRQQSSESPQKGAKVDNLKEGNFEDNEESIQEDEDEGYDEEGMVDQHDA